MANNFFQFKQFTIHQDNCAMKVCTDACLFGALLSSNPLKENFDALDIGTGTGLLSLMYAQKDPGAIIDAVEINAAAANQAKENFEASPWKDRLHIINEDIKDFIPQKKYGLIFCNPPFYEDDLRSADETKNAAKHDTTLSLEELIKTVDTNLNENGIFAVLLPFHRLEYFEKEAAKYGFHMINKILIRQSPGHNFFRGILLFSKKKNELQLTKMAIRNEEGNYTTEFIELLKDYYLNL